MNAQPTGIILSESKTSSRRSKHNPELNFKTLHASLASVKINANFSTRRKRQENKRLSGRTRRTFCENAMAKPNEQKGPLHISPNDERYAFSSIWYTTNSISEREHNLDVLGWLCFFRIWTTCLTEGTMNSPHQKIQPKVYDLKHKHSLVMQ